jgi:hypothetical protein
VKPSERLEEIYHSLLKQRLAEYPDGVEPRELPLIGLGCTQKAVAQFVDERHEREEQLEQALTLTLAVLAGRLYQKQPGDVGIGPAPGAPPDLPPRVAELLKEIAAYPRRNWSIPEPADYCEALFQWLEEGARG